MAKVEHTGIKGKTCFPGVTEDTLTQLNASIATVEAHY